MTALRGIQPTLCLSEFTRLFSECLVTSSTERADKRCRFAIFCLRDSRRVLPTMT